MLESSRPGTEKESAGDPLKGADLFPAADSSWQSFRTEAKTSSSKIIINPEKEWINDRTLQNMLYGGVPPIPAAAGEGFVNITSSTAPATGTLIESRMVMTARGSGTIFLRFKGNNLQDKIITDDALLEIDFSLAHLDTFDAAETYNRLSKALTALSDASTPGFEDIESLTSAVPVSELQEVLQKEAAIVTGIGVNNAIISSEKRFSSAIFHGILSDSSSRLAHDLNETVMKNVVLENVSFAGLEGRLEKCRLESCDVRGGSVRIATDSRSVIKNISAYGALLSGDINCSLSGDFRKARLGGNLKENRLSGKTFASTGNNLTSTAGALLRGSIFSHSTASDGVTALSINNVEVKLSDVSATTKLARNLKRSPDYNFMVDIPASKVASEAFLSSRLPLPVYSGLTTDDNLREYLFKIPGQPDVMGSLIRKELPAGSSYSLKIYQTPVDDYARDLRQLTADTRTPELKESLQLEVPEVVVEINGKGSPDSQHDSIPYSTYFSRPLAGVVPGMQSEDSIAPSLLYLRRLIRNAMIIDYDELLKLARENAKKK